MCHPLVGWGREMIQDFINNTNVCSQWICRSIETHFDDNTKVCVVSVFLPLL